MIKSKSRPCAHERRRSARGGLLIVAAVAAVVVFTAGGSVVQAAGDEPVTERIKSRDGNEIEVEYGWLDVPENRDKSDTRSITLAYMRVRYPMDDPGTPVFPLAGGPGGSSIDIVKRNLVGGGRFYLGLLGGDVVAIDQRGVGASRPELSSDTRFETPVGEPGDRAQILARMRDVCREEAARWRADGVDLDGYTTKESADDIDAVREALGYDKISLWGESYGTHLALATIRRHEAHIDRAVLVGPEGPDHTMKLPSATEAGLRRVAELVAEDPWLSEDIPDFMEMVISVLERLEDAPVYVDVDGESIGISKFDLQCELAQAIGILHGNNCLRVPARIKAMADGDFEEFARELRQSRHESGVGSVMQMIMDCASGASPARLRQIEEEAENCLLGDAVNFPFDGLAEAWGAPDLGETFRGPLRTEVPILFLTGDVDSRTPTRNAEELMADMPNAHLIEVENAAHDLNWLQPELRELWSRFLAGEAPEISRVVGPKVKFERPR